MGEKSNKVLNPKSNSIAFSLSSSVSFSICIVKMQQFLIKLQAKNAQKEIKSNDFLIVSVFAGVDEAIFKQWNAIVCNFMLAIEKNHQCIVKCNFLRPKSLAGLDVLTKMPTFDSTLLVTMREIFIRHPQAIRGNIGFSPASTIGDEKWMKWKSNSKAKCQTPITITTKIIGVRGRETVWNFERDFIWESNKKKHRKADQGKLFLFAD